MEIDFIKILTVVIPLVVNLLNNKVPREKVDPYLDAAKHSDVVFDSLLQLALKIKQTDQNLENKDDTCNFKSGVDIVEKMIKGYEDRLAQIREISGLY